MAPSMSYGTAIRGPSVIPAKAGIQSFRVQQDAGADALDSRLRGNDEAGGFGNDDREADAMPASLAAFPRLGCSPSTTR